MHPTSPPHPLPRQLLPQWGCQFSMRLRGPLQWLTLMPQERPWLPLPQLQYFPQPFNMNLLASTTPLCHEVPCKKTNKQKHYQRDFAKCSACNSTFIPELPQLRKAWFKIRSFHGVRNAIYIKSLLCCTISLASTWSLGRCNLYGMMPLASTGNEVCFAISRVFDRVFFANDLFAPVGESVFLGE